MSEEFVPFNAETDPRYNREPGVVPVPGSNYLKEVAKFEQFHGKWTMGTKGPGNPYVYREYPKMLFRAMRWQGKPACMAAIPDPMDFRDPREAERAEHAAIKFTRDCQRVVKDETEAQRAYEDNWRDSPQEAMDALLARDREVSNVTAQRNYEDRNMSEGAKREIAAQVAEAGGDHQPEVKRKPVRRRKTVKRA